MSPYKTKAFPPLASERCSRTRRQRNCAHMHSMCEKDSTSHCWFDDWGKSPWTEKYGQSPEAEKTPGRQPATSILQPHGTQFGQQPEYAWRRILFWMFQKGMKPWWHFDFCETSATLCLDFWPTEVWENKWMFSLLYNKHKQDVNIFVQGWHIESMASVPESQEGIYTQG